MLMSKRANSGVFGICWPVIEVTKSKTYDQKEVNTVQFQKICNRDPTDPHALQQYGDAVGNALEILKGV